jgi:hypothetical protein
MELMERSVRSADIEDGDTLVILFETGVRLRFVPLPNYESYRVTVGDETLII